MSHKQKLSILKLKTITVKNVNLHINVQHKIRIVFILSFQVSPS